MIEKCEKPECFKKTEDFYYIRGFDENGTYAYFALDLRFPGAAVLHLEAIRFSHGILKKMKIDWEGVKRILNVNGVKILTATRIGTIDEYKEWIKFIRHFGFNDVKQQVTAVQSI
jgi:hypothetical protein